MSDVCFEIFFGLKSKGAHHRSFAQAPPPETLLRHRTRYRTHLSADDTRDQLVRGTASRRRKRGKIIRRRRGVGRVIISGDEFFRAREITTLARRRASSACRVTDVADCRLTPGVKVGRH